MKLDLGCTMQFDAMWPTPTIMMLRPRTGASQRVLAERFETDPVIPVAEFTDSFGNLAQRLVMPAGPSHIRVSATVETADHIDVDVTAPRVPIEELPDDAMRFLLPSRYCPSDLMFDQAIEVTRGALPGYPQADAVRAWIAAEISYQYGASSMSTSALDTLASRRGVCRDFAHLGISLCRAIDIPARMVAGYLHDLEPMDAHAWFEAFVGGRWFTFDPTQRLAKGNRVIVAYGRDAADVAMVTQFGPMRLTAMEVAVAPAAVAQRS